MQYHDVFNYPNILSGIFFLKTGDPHNTAKYCIKFYKAYLNTI